MMRSRIRNSLFAAAAFSFVLMNFTGAGLAQQGGAPAAESTSGPPVQTPSKISEGIGCNSRPRPASAGGASIAQATGPGLQPKNWQAPGGEIEFSVKSFNPIPPNASVSVCFRWKSDDPAAQYFEVRPDRLDLSSDGKILKVAAYIPARTAIPGVRKDFSIGIVPLADVRILATAPAPSDGRPPAVALDVSTNIGVTSIIWGIALGLTAVVLIYGALVLACIRRMRLRGVSPWSPLSLITLPSGYASLSQFQVVLWTFVVAGSAVYVMAISGELIQITSGTLVLLGISGLAVVGAKIHNEAQTPTAQAATTQPPAPTSPPETPVLRYQLPRWSDLVINETIAPDGTVLNREIDVTRVQMLAFTGITAVFVVLKVLTTYVIPDIPDGFQILMGVSNAVYMGSKVAQKDPMKGGGS